ncbi:MAG: TetR/AcrR family transcriptional regulator [Pseudomonadota bacterium]
MPRSTFRNLPEAKRARIAEAAIEEFAERGYGGASISAIVARAGIAKGSFYQYFENKADLFRWLVMDHTVQLKMRYISARTTPEIGDFWSQIADMMLAGIRFGLDNPRLSRMAAILWHPTADPELAALLNEFQALTRRSMGLLLQQGQATGHVRTDLDLEVAGDFMVAQLMQGLDLAIQRRIGTDLISFCAQPELADRFRERDQRHVIAALIDLLRRALGTPKPPIRMADEPLIDLERLVDEAREPPKGGGSAR